MLKIVGRIFFAALLFAFAGILHFSALDFGTPSSQRTLQIFGSWENLDSWIDPLMALRDQYYQDVQNLLESSKDATSADYNKIYRSEVDQFAVAPQKLVLSRMRSYLLGVWNSDEQNTLVAVSKLNPLKLRFDPGVNTFYGGFYYYTCGGALLVSKFLGRLHLDPNPQFYLNHPEDIGAMYKAIRSIGGVSLILTMLLLLGWVTRLQNFSLGWLGAAMLATMPSVVDYSHMAKAHLYAMFLTFLGFYWIWKTVENPRWLYYILGSLALGASAGSILPNLTVGIILFFVECARHQWNLKAVFTSRKFYAGCVIFFMVYAVTNYYILIHFSQFQKMLWLLKEYMGSYGEGYGQLRLQNWIPFFKATWTSGLHPYLLPLLLAGIYAAFSKKEPLFVTLFWIVSFLTLVNFMTTRHLGLHFRVMPMICMLALRGVQFLFVGRGVPAKAGLIFFLLIGIGVSSAHSWFELSLIRREDVSIQQGKWINENVPQESTIGLNVPMLSPVSYPPIQFLRYRLVQWDASIQDFPRQEKDLPDYILAGSSHHPILDQSYAVVKVWRAPQNKFLGVPSFFSYASDLFLLKKK